MSEKRLTALASYQQLPPKLQSVLKLALLHRVPGPQAVSLLNLPNPARTWESERAQRVVAQYGGADPETDYLAALEAMREPPVEPAIPIPIEQIQSKVEAALLRHVWNGSGLLRNPTGNADLDAHFNEEEIQAQLARAGVRDPLSRQRAIEEYRQAEIDAQTELQQRLAQERYEEFMSH